MRRGEKASGIAARPRRRLALLAMLAAPLGCPSAVAAGSDPPKLVVVLYPNECDGAPGVQLTDRGIRAAFAGEPPGRVELHNEYIDTTRLRDAEFRRAQVAFLRQKYAGRPVGLVIAGLSSALDFAVDHRDELFPGVPVVFTAVDQREVTARRLPPDVIGTPIRMDLTGTLDTALRLHPATRRVFVVAGAAPFDAYWEAEAWRSFRPYEDRLEFVYLVGLPMDELLGRVAGLPDQSIVYYLHVFKDGTGKTLVPAEVLDRLAAAATAPVYGHVDTYIGRGVVGGRVFSFEAEGRNAGRLGLRVLAGETAALPEPSESVGVFDWRQLRRWGVSERRLPPGSVVRHREPTVWDDYKWRIVGAAAVCLVQGLLIAGLLVQRVSRRRADGRFQQVVETAATGMLLVGRDGTIVLANAQVEKLFGYQKAELLGRPVECLVPERLRGHHPAERRRYFAAPEARHMGHGRDLFGRRKDGHEFPVEIGLSPIVIDRGQFVLASIVDLTARKQAEEELRQSRQELQRLAGRLLEVREVECRRIARELHDDLSQSLALLSLELDALGQAPPKSAAGVSDRMHELADRVKELSTAIHHLSHRLHPSKLEHLGLTAAVASLCNEVAQSHGLDVKFTHHPDLPAVAPDAALCLYRVAQEALRNVVKHSGSRRATVRLSGTVDSISLRVADDGVGFQPGSEVGAGGIGLVSMRERLNLVGGAVHIDSRRSGGTRVCARVPVSAPERPADDAQRAWPAASDLTPGTRPEVFR